MHRHHAPLALALLGVPACAQPTSFQPDLALVSLLNGSVVQDSLFPYSLVDLAPGEQVVLDPLTPTLNASLRVSYDFETNANERTVTLRYETTDASPFFTTAFVDLLTISFGTDFAVFFGVGFDDPQWTGAPVTRLRRLLGDGVDLFSSTPVVLSPSELSPQLIGLVDENSPAGPGFGLPINLTGGAIADTFIYELTYPIVPSQCAWALIIGAASLRARRR